MTPERWKRTEELYHASLACPPGERTAFLAEACPDDEPMRRDVGSLLNEPGSDDGFLDEPALAMAAHMVSDLAPAAMSGRTLGGYPNLTDTIKSSTNPVSILRAVGFSGDSARVWFGSIPRHKMDMPWSGGTPRPFLQDGDHTPAWSSDGRLVFFNNGPGDFMSLADYAGRNARKINIAWPAAAGTRPPTDFHNHNMVWSPDNTWIYFVHGVVRDLNHQTFEMDIWRISPSGGSPERLTYLNAALTFLAMLDQDTLVLLNPSHRDRVEVLAAEASPESGVSRIDPRARYLDHD